jgi:hypothetical protein
VGYEGCAEELRTGIERVEGICDLGMEMGRWDEDRQEMPASILEEMIN